MTMREPGYRMKLAGAIQLERFLHEDKERPKEWTDAELLDQAAQIWKAMIAAAPFDPSGEKAK